MEYKNELMELLINFDMEEAVKLFKAIDYCIMNWHKVLICWNGWSAADAQHFAAELIWRFETERMPLPAIALTTDTSILTAIANDYDYGNVFRRQVVWLGNPGDLLIAISTSGNSENVLEAVDAAKMMNMDTFGLLWKDGWKLVKECKQSIVIPSNRTSHVQELHEIIYHYVCSLIDLDLWS